MSPRSCKFPTFSSRPSPSSHHARHLKWWSSTSAEETRLFSCFVNQPTPEYPKYGKLTLWPDHHPYSSIVGWSTKFCLLLVFTLWPSIIITKRHVGHLIIFRKVQCTQLLIRTLSADAFSPTPLTSAGWAPHRSAVELFYATHPYREVDPKQNERCVMETAWTEQSSH